MIILRTIKKGKPNRASTFHANVFCDVKILQIEFLGI